MYITRCQREGTCKENLHNCNTDGQEVHDECFDRCPRCADAQKHKQASAYLRHALAKVHWEGGGKLHSDGEDLIIRRSTYAQQ